MKKSNQMIVVEIPHQRSPKVWVAEGVDDLIRAAHDAQSDNDDRVITDKETAIEVMGSDLHSLTVIEDQEHYDMVVRGDRSRGDKGHQYASYISDLREAGRDLGFETDDQQRNCLDWYDWLSAAHISRGDLGFETDDRE